MEDFSIITRLTASEYSKAMLIGLYKKPGTILTTIFGLYIVTTAILQDETSAVVTICGVIMIASPFVITLITRRQFLSNPSMQKEITYTFSEGGLHIQGSTFSGDYVWAHIIKQKDISHFLVLYHTKKFGTFIDKRQLTTEQIAFIKTKIGAQQ